MRGEHRFYAKILRLWNTVGLTQAQIGETLDLPRGSVGRLLFELRKRNVYVRSYTKYQIASRAHASRQRKDPNYGTDQAALMRSRQALKRKQRTML